MSERVNILGVGIRALGMEEALETIKGWVEGRQSQYVCVTSGQGVMDSIREPELRGIFNGSGITTPDGMSIVWLLRLHGKRRASRVYGPDLMRRACERSVDSGIRHFLFGGAEEVADTLKARLMREFPGLQVVGTHWPPFRPLAQEKDLAVIQKISSLEADVVWVGLNTPKQER